MRAVPLALSLALSCSLATAALAAKKAPKLPPTGKCTIEQKQTCAKGASKGKCAPTMKFAVKGGNKVGKAECDRAAISWSKPPTGQVVKTRKVYQVWNGKRTLLYQWPDEELGD